MRVRKAVLKAHLALALLPGLLLILTTGSGSVLIFRREIDRAFHPRLFRRTPGPEVGFDRAWNSARRAFPGRDLGVLYAPALPRTQGVYVVRLAGGPEIDVHVDPGTGAILGWRRPQDDPLEWLFQFHAHLLTDPVGSTLVGLGGGCLLGMIATGVWLWWPGRRKLGLGFRIRRGRGWFMLGGDLHRALGAGVAPLLSPIALTGVLLTFDGCAERLIHALFLSAPEPIPPEAEEITPSGGTDRLPLETLRRIAERSVPGSTTTFLKWPRKPGASVQVRLKAPASPHPNGRSVVHLAPSTGRVLWSEDERQFSRAESLHKAWLYPLHIGTYGGGPSRALHLLAGLGPPVLLATGLLIWRHHARARWITARVRRRPPLR